MKDLEESFKDVSETRIALVENKISLIPLQMKPAGAHGRLAPQRGDSGQKRV